MSINRKMNNVPFLIAGIAIAVLTSSMGCRSGGFTKPDLGKMAFWKPENSIFASKTKNKMPPPPARHFDPAPLGGASDTQAMYAESDTGLKQNYKNDIEKMRAEIDAAAKKLNQPIREPYGSDLKNSAEGLANNVKSGFEASSNKVQSKLSELDDNSFGGGLNTSQNNFQTAMNNSLEAAKAQAKDFAAPTKNVNDLTTGWKEDISLPTGLNSKIDQSLANVNKAIYDVNGKLTSSSDQVKNQFNQKLQSLEDNSFAAQSPAQNTVNGFQASANGLQAPTNSFAANSQPRAPVSQPAAPASQPVNAFSFPAAAQVASQSDRELQKVQAQMEEAKRQIEQLKQQVASAGQQAISRSQPVAQVAQLQVPGFSSQQFQAPATNVTNPLRSSEPLQPQLQSSGSLQPAAPSYPSTSHGQFAPSNNNFGGNFAPQQNKSAPPTAAQVGFQSTNNQSMVVTTGQVNSEFGSTATQVKNNVMEVDIPAAILSGSGSYAPGSVQPLR